MKVHSYGLMVLKSPTQDGIVVNPIMLAMKTVQIFLLRTLGMIYLVLMNYRVTSVALLVRFDLCYIHALEIKYFDCLTAKC